MLKRLNQSTSNMQSSVKYIVYALLLIAMLTAGCDDTTAPTNKSELILMPLAIGNHWIAKVRWYNPDGTLVSARLDTLNIIDTSTVGGKLYHISNIGDYYRNDADGLRIFYGSPSGNSNYIKFPAAVGDTFNSIAYVSDDGDDTTFTWMELMATDILISVPAGNFKCYHYKYFDDYPGMPEGFNTFIAPGIGFVKREYFGDEDDGNSFTEQTFVLNAYQVK